jgi:arsenate reductase
MGRKRILFLCTGNAARSQMAEGLANGFHGDVVDAVSAGSRPAGWVHPSAIQVMALIGIDVSSATSKGAEQFLGQAFDVVVTVCDFAAKDCPSWPNARRVEHWPIEDPSWGEADTLERFIATRDELAKRIDGLVAEMQQ